MNFNLDARWKFNALEVYDYTRSGKLSKVFEWLANQSLGKGAFVEFGVYRGSSLISVAHWLSSRGLSNQVVGFDTFSGFPDQAKSKKDHRSNFELFGDRDLLEMVREHQFV